MAEVAAAPAAPLTLEEKKAAARARAQAARQAEAGGEAFVTISPGAADYIRAAAAGAGTPRGRAPADPGGRAARAWSTSSTCSARASAPTEGDREVVSNGVTMLMDLKSAIHVTGSVIDYEQGLLRRGFRINNPNATSTCSCGDSFGA